VARIDANVHAGWVANTRDLSFLPPTLASAGRSSRSGTDILWPRVLAAQVINAVADSGRIVLGLDLRSGGDDEFQLDSLPNFLSTTSVLSVTIHTRPNGPGLTPLPLWIDLNS
jgi:hypothetical protein